MLLTITSTTPPARALGFLLHKHPDRLQSFELSFGHAHVFYPEATDARTTFALLLDVDTVALTRRPARAGGEAFGLQPYVNDRRYVASSFLSVAIAQTLRTAMAGRCEAQPHLPDQPLNLEIALHGLAAHGEPDLTPRLFEPLGYTVTQRRQPLNPAAPEWGDSPYVQAVLAICAPLRDALRHIYVLLPVLDNEKHYWVGEEEVEKLLRLGEDWLAGHPLREFIVARYLRHQRGLMRAALARLSDELDTSGEPDTAAIDAEEVAFEALVTSRAAEDGISNEAAASVPPSVSAAAAPEPLRRVDEHYTLHEMRLGTVLATLASLDVRSVADLGCGEGRLLARLQREARFERILGMDISTRALPIAAERLNWERLTPAERERIALIHGALTYRDTRLSGYDAAVLIEVIEHIEPERVRAVERAIFEFARPRFVLVTTPNREFNVRFERLPAGCFRHRDHRFEWTRAEFTEWVRRVGDRFGYAGTIRPIGPVDPELGPPTQMAVFRVNEPAATGVVP